MPNDTFAQNLAHQIALKKFYYTVAVKYRIVLMKILETGDTGTGDYIENLIGDVLHETDRMDKPEITDDAK